MSLLPWRWRGLLVHNRGLLWLAHQIALDDPLRAVSLSIFVQAMTVGTLAECVVFLRRWELYLATLICLFLALAASYILGYARVVELKDALAAHAQGPVTAAPPQKDAQSSGDGRS